MNIEGEEEQIYGKKDKERMVNAKCSKDIDLKID